MTRVAVTGLGCVSPVGASADESFRSLLLGRSGVRTITRFPAGGFSTTFAAEIDRNMKRLTAAVAADEAAPTAEGVSE